VSETRSVVLGSGGYLPARVMTNADLSQIVDTSDEWITQRTGIKERHIAADGELTSDLAVAAAKAALADAGMTIADIDLIVMATATPDFTFPAAAVTVQEKLGMLHGAAFDVQAVCSGFIYALTSADAMIKAGQAKRALVVGAETFSRILDWTDRTTCVLFGDGAGAVVLGAATASEGSRDRGVLASKLRSDGRYRDKLYVDGGPSTGPAVGHLRMEGREVYRHAVTMITDVIEEAFAAAGVTADEIDWFVPHQANVRIIDASAKKLGIPSEKVVRTVDRHGNTSAASIPLALSVAVRDGRIKKGDLVLLEAMGGGFTWGAVLVRW
jgi:3-oxoacyl-[acyl-carrier-protein] synthase-3